MEAESQEAFWEAFYRENPKMQRTIRDISEPDDQPSPQIKDDDESSEGYSREEIDI